MLCLRVIVEDFAFGNPPGYAHANFLEAKITFLTISMRCACAGVQPTGCESFRHSACTHRSPLSHWAPVACVTML